jgi:hypothetical protein
MKDRSMLEEFTQDLEYLTAIMEADNKPVFVAPGDPKDRQEPPVWQKELDADTIMNDCNAKDCFFWNEGFKGNCRLPQIELDEQHICKHFKPKATENRTRK